MNDALADSMRRTLREIRRTHGYDNVFWNDLCDQLVVALVETLGLDDEPEAA